MKEKKGYSIDIEQLPDLLRGIGNLILMAQNAPIAMPDESMYAIDTLLQYIADDMEPQIDLMYYMIKEGKTA